MTLWLIVAVGTTDAIVSVAEVILRDVRDAILVRSEDQVLLEHRRPELPARGKRQATTEGRELVELLIWMGDEAEGLHSPRVALWVVQDEYLLALVEAELGVAPDRDVLIVAATRFETETLQIQPVHPACFHAAEVQLLAHLDLDPVERPHAGTVLERGKHVVLVLHFIDVDLVQERRGT